MGVKKGQWSGEEDRLLRRCVAKYGEGNWHLVPERAGLNRCRKSCRLRWLDYLHPDVNREEYKEDEVDLIIRMHKLLGNRWSLIAGRLPGRTACHVKNYWKSHLRKEFSFPLKPKGHHVIKPQPRYFNLKCDSNIQQTKQQKEGEMQKTPTGEVPDRWWEDLLLQADAVPNENTDVKGGPWDDLLSMDNWLMED